MNVSIKSRLYTGFAFAILLVLLVGIIAMATFQKQFREGELVKHTYKVINQLDSIQKSLIDMETGRRGFRSTNDKIFLEPYYLAQQNLQPLLVRLHELVKDNRGQIQRVAVLLKDIESLQIFWTNFGDNADKYSHEELSKRMYAEKARMDAIRVMLTKMVSAENELLVAREEDNRQSVLSAKWGLVTGILLILVTVMLLISQIVKEFKNRRKAEENLHKNYKALTVVNNENEQRNWLLNGLAKVNDVLQNQTDATALVKGVLDALVKYLQLQSGAFYIYDEDRSKLVLAAAYALPHETKKEYKLHEGLVGEAAAHEEPFIISDIPAKYATSCGGIVSVEAIQAVYVSFYNEGELKGVIELLSFKEINHQFISLLKLVSNNISVALHSAKAREKVLQLFEKVQQQKEALEHQQEELRQTNEELTVQAEALQSSEEELRVQEEELRQINGELKEKNVTIETARQALSLKAKELEESNKYKSEFLANMSHELRTPLNSVLILSKLLADNKDQTLTDKQVNHAKIIYKSGSDLLNLINDILDLSKIEAGKADVHIEDVPVKSIATDMEQLFAAVAEEKAIDYHVEILPNVSENIQTDRQKIEQVLKNLLSNAFKFTPEKGQVLLQFRQVSKNETNYLSILVKDTGIGVPREKQQIIFEAFQQAEGSTNRKFGGTGLGLSITKELVKILKGEIQLESVPEKGSIFTIIIPCVLTLNEKDIAQNNTKSNASKTPFEIPEQTKIAEEKHLFSREDHVMLIIEDDKKFANIISEFAVANGYTPIVALSGNDGLHYAKKYNPSAIILDIQLPGIDGWTLLKLFKQDKDLKHIPVHIISAGENEKALSAGALAFLKKPVEKDDLDNAFSLISEYLKSSVKRLLIFTADSLNEETFRKLIYEKNYDIVSDVAHSLDEGLDKLNRIKYDCIIADIGANIEEGISTLANLNSHLLPDHIPTIIYLDSDISAADELKMKRIADVVVRKSSFSHNRLLDELELFLYKVHQTNRLLQTPLKKHVDGETALHGKKVLLVDDDMRNIFALSALLEQERMQVITANDGKEALDFLKKDKTIDIVLMDIMMPEMDGYEAIASIRNELKLGHLPVIALTAKAMAGDREKCLDAGASDYIPKPVDTQKLISLIRVWLS